MSRKPIEDWDNSSWTCPDCNHENSMDFWPYIEECKKCLKCHEFDTDYYGYDNIGVNYVGPAKDNNER